jgi:hypothetical protein
MIGCNFRPGCHNISMRAKTGWFYKTHTAASNQGRRTVNTCAVTGWFYTTHVATFNQEWRKVSTCAVTGWFYKIHKYSSLYHPVWRNTKCTAMLILQNTRVLSTGVTQREHVWGDRLILQNIHARTHTHTHRPMCRDARVRSDRLTELLHMSRDMNYACRNRSILQYTIWSFTRIGMPSDKTTKMWKILVRHWSNKLRTQIFFLEPCISLIIRQNQQMHQLLFNVLVMYGGSYMFRYYIAILRERS